MTQENNRQLLKFYLEGGYLDQKPIKPQPERAEALQEHMDEKELLIKSYRDENKLPLGFLLREAKENKEREKKEKSKKK